MAILTTDAHCLSAEFERTIWKDHRVTLIDESEAPWVVRFHGDTKALEAMYSDSWGVDNTEMSLIEDGSIVDDAATDQHAVTVARIKQEIFDDIDAGKLPVDVASFSALHDYVDANAYGGFCEDEIADALIKYFGGRDKHEGMPEGMVSFINEAHESIDVWLKLRLDDMSKFLFSATWGDDFHDKGTKDVPLSFFNDANGYTTSDINAIARLDVGQVWNCKDFGSHTVTRLPDAIQAQ